MSTHETICGLKIHPTAAMFPLMDGAEFDELVESIRQHGILVPILVANKDAQLHNTRAARPPMVVLDGRNRLRAWEVLSSRGVVKADGWQEHATDAAFVLNPENEDEVRDYIVAANIHRRHLTPDQRASLAVKMLPSIEAEAAAAKKATQVANGKAPTVRSKVTEPATPEKKRDHAAERRRSTAGKVAELAKVSTSKAKQAVKVAKAEAKGDLPKGTMAAVESGTVRLATVAKGVAKKATEAQASDAKKSPQVSPLELAVRRRWKQMSKHDAEWGVADMSTVCSLFLKVIKEELDARKAGTFAA